MNTYAVVVSEQLNNCLIELYQQFAGQCGPEIQCVPLSYTEQSCEDLWDHLAAHRYNGVVVSSRLSASLFEYADLHGESALSSGLSHTLVFQDGVAFADNTETLAFLADINKHTSHALAEMRPLIIGSGRTALSLVVAFVKEGIPVTVANRSYAKAKRLMHVCEHHAIGTYVDVVAWEEIGDLDVNMIVNSTKLSIQDVHVPVTLLERVSFWYECSFYSLEHFRLMQAYAKRYQMDFADGWGFLLESAAETFLLWEGVFPNTDLLFSDQQRALIFPE